MCGPSHRLGCGLIHAKADEDQLCALRCPECRMPAISVLTKRLGGSTATSAAVAVRPHVYLNMNEVGLLCLFPKRCLSRSSPVWNIGGPIFNDAHERPLAMVFAPNPQSRQGPTIMGVPSLGSGIMNVRRLSVVAAQEETFRTVPKSGIER